MPSGPPHPPSPFRRWGIQDVAGWFLVAQFGGFLAFKLVANPSGETSGVLSIPALFLASLGLWFGYGAGPLITSRSRGRGPVADFGTELKARDAPLGIALGVFTQLVLIRILYWPLLRWVIDEEPGEAARELTERVNTSTDLVLITIMVVVMAPLVEELFYRGFLLSALRFHFGDWTSILLSAGLFALIHLEAINLPGLFMFGVIAGLLRVKTGRLGPAWMFHAGFNAATLWILLGP